MNLIARLSLRAVTLR